jgi:hypothetical protein
MSSKNNYDLSNQQINEKHNKSEQNSIIENDFTELNNEIAKVILEQNDIDENISQNEKFNDNDFNLLKLNSNQEINYPYKNNQINQNQGNMYQLLNNINNKSIKNKQNILSSQTIYQLQNQLNQNNNGNNIFIMNNYINNNVNNFGMYQKIPNLNFSNYQNQNVIYNNKYSGTPNFNYINNNQLTPILTEHQYYSPNIPYNPFLKKKYKNMNFQLNNNNENNNDFHSVHINNLNSNNEKTNDEIILNKMITKQSKFNKNKKNSNKNQSNFDNSNTKSNIILNQNKKTNQEEEKNKIDILNIILHKDKRTTLMIKNIPNKYTINTFLEEINIDFKNKYDIFYLPIDYANKCNLGFAFINFVDTFHIIDFYDCYRGKKWKRFNSEKKCELLYAKFQGKKELINHFEKGKVLSFESEDKRPLILPTPNPFPKITIPFKYLELFKSNYPFLKYSVKISKNNDDKKFILDNFFF